MYAVMKASRFMKMLMLLLFIFVMSIGITYAQDNDGSGILPNAGGSGGKDGDGGITGDPQYNVYVLVDSLIRDILPLFTTETPAGLEITGQEYSQVKLKEMDANNMKLEDFGHTHKIALYSMPETETVVYNSETAIVVDGGYTARTKLYQVLNDYINLRLTKKHETKGAAVFLWAVTEEEIADKNYLDKWLVTGLDESFLVMRTDGNLDLSEMIKGAFDDNDSSQVEKFGILVAEEDENGNVIKKTAMLMTLQPPTPGTLHDEIELEVKSVEL